MLGKIPVVRGIIDTTLSRDTMHTVNYTLYIFWIKYSVHSKLEYKQCTFLEKLQSTLHTVNCQLLREAYTEEM